MPFPRASTTSVRTPGSELPTTHDKILVLQHNCANGKQVVEALQAGRMEADIMNREK